MLLCQLALRGIFQIFLIWCGHSISSDPSQNLLCSDPSQNLVPPSPPRLSLLSPLCHLCPCTEFWDLWVRNELQVPPRAPAGVPGVFLRCSWGIPVVPAVPGVFLECSWGVPGVLGMFLGYSWSVPGVCLRCSWCSWGALGVFLECS